MKFKHRPIWTYNVTIDEFKIDDIPGEARTFIQRGVIPQLEENGFECDEFDVMVCFGPRPDTMNLNFMLFKEHKIGLLEISLPSKLDQYEICENLDDLIADALEPGYHDVIKWTREEVNLRYLELFIECINKPTEEMFKNGLFDISISDKYVRSTSNGFAVYHNGIFRGFVEQEFIRDIIDVAKNDLMEPMNEERMTLVRLKYNRFYQHYIILHPDNKLHEKMEWEDNNVEHKIHE